MMVTAHHTIVGSTLFIVFFSAGISMRYPSVKKSTSINKIVENAVQKKCVSKNIRKSPESSHVFQRSPCQLFISENICFVSHVIISGAKKSLTIQARRAVFSFSRQLLSPRITFEKYPMTIRALLSVGYFRYNGIKNTTYRPMIA